jgi:hypothetical protein
MGKPTFTVFQFAFRFGGGRVWTIVERYYDLNS